MKERMLYTDDIVIVTEIEKLHIMWMNKEKKKN